MKCIQTCNSNMETHVCPLFEEKRRRGGIDTERGILYLCTNHAIKSSRLFKEKRNALIDSIPRVDRERDKIEDDIRNNIKRHIHNLVALNAQSIQSIYSTIPQHKFLKRDRGSLISSIRDSIVESPEDTAVLIIDLLKNETLEKTEFAVYNKLFEGEPLDKRSYEIHRVLLLVLNSFWRDFSKNDVYIDIGECYSQVHVDFDVLAATFSTLLKTPQNIYYQDLNFGFDF